MDAADATALTERLSISSSALRSGPYSDRANRAEQTVLRTFRAHLVSGVPALTATAAIARPGDEFAPEVFGYSGDFVVHVAMTAAAKGATAQAITNVYPRTSFARWTRTSAATDAVASIAFVAPYWTLVVPTAAPETEAWADTLIARTGLPPAR